MDATQRLINRKALDILAGIEAGLPRETIYDQVERMIGRRVTVAERDLSFAQCLDHGWIYDYPDPVLDQTLVAISTKGKTERVSL